jgi:hypothetical protein
MKSYGVINDNIAYNHIETKEEWVRLEHKSYGQRKRQNKRYKVSEEVTDREVKEAAEREGILNERKAKRDDKAKDNIGHLRRLLSEKERKKMGKRAKFHESAQGKALKEIRKREYESTTNESEWSKVDPVDPVDPIGTKETSEKDKAGAAQATQDNRQREAIRKVAEAAKNMKLQLKELQQSNANPTNMSDDLDVQMDSLLEGLEKTDAENRKMADELASKETLTPIP